MVKWVNDQNEKESLIFQSVSLTYSIYCCFGIIVSLFAILAWGLAASRPTLKRKPFQACFKKTAACKHFNSKKAAFYITISLPFYHFDEKYHNCASGTTMSLKSGNAITMLRHQHLK
jgi:hypothetical protein